MLLRVASSASLSRFCKVPLILAPYAGGGAVCLDEPDAEEAALAGAQPLQDQSEDAARSFPDFTAKSF